MKLLPRFAFILLPALAGTPGSATGPGAPPWTVFRPATSSLPMSPSPLINADFEQGTNGWRPYGLGFELDPTGGRGGSRGVKLVNPVPTETRGVSQTIFFNQATARPLYFSAWSKASSVTGAPDGDYSLYLDLLFMDNTTLYGQVLVFDPGTHDWQFREGFIPQTKPIRSVSVYCLLRVSHGGTAWFDDLTVREVQVSLAAFDGANVAFGTPSPPPFGGATLKLGTEDGLSVNLASQGGAVTDVRLGGTPVHDPAQAYAGGFFVRDAMSLGDFVHVGGLLAPVVGGVAHTAEIASLGLRFRATYTASADRIQIQAVLTDLTGQRRAVTLYFALPIAAEGWTWGDDIRTQRTVTGLAELLNPSLSYQGLGATGRLSRYPWSALSGPAGGLSIAVPLHAPRVLRLVENPVTRQHYAAFDLGLSPDTARFPAEASVELVLYRFDPAWGFRAATRGYHDRFPAAFRRRVPAKREGGWVAFSDLSRVSGLQDFGIAFHEIGSASQVTFDDAAGIYSFRYVSEPWSHWLPLNAAVDPNNYNQVLAYLMDRWRNGSLAERRAAEATLSSGCFDEQGRYRYRSEPRPWCQGTNGCVVFTLNPDADIADPTYPLNKARLNWNDAVRQTYATLPGLEGEYVDSLHAEALTMDLRTAHFGATDTPLTWRTADRAVGIAEVFAVTEFARWLAADVHDNLGRWTMANAIANDLPWGADLFDVMGHEINWLSTGSFVPDPDWLMSCRRTLAATRPYCLLMNTNFANFTYDLVERYFQVCLFYGLYPGMFSADAATLRYWDDPALYNRDRPLFRRYLPWVRRLNEGGWQPVTRARSSDPAVHVERFGAWPDLWFTLRNTASTPITLTLIVERAPLGLPSSIPAAAVFSWTQHRLATAGSNLVVTLTIGAGATEILAVGRKLADLESPR